MATNCEMQERNPHDTVKKTIHLKYVFSDSIELDITPWRLQLFSNELWLAGDKKGILVYNTDCKLLKQIKLAEIKSVYGVTKTETNYIIVATDSRLLQLCPNGSVLSTLVEGTFSDVCVNGNIIYALDYKLCQIIVFGSAGKNQWKKSKEITLCYSNGALGDKLISDDSKLYVSSVHNCCIFVYSMQGVFDYQTGVQGSHEGEKLLCPYISDLDTKGDLLVCDYWNHRLKMFSPSTKQWGHVTLVKWRGWPVSAVVDEHHIWVVTKTEPCQLLRYQQFGDSACAYLEDIKNFKKRRHHMTAY